MSVDITARIGVGWIISQEKREEMCAAAGEQIGEVEDCFHYINGYDENTKVFFGDYIASVDAGEYLDLEDFSRDFDMESFARDYEDILARCGEEVRIDNDWSNPKLYLINQLW